MAAIMSERNRGGARPVRWVVPLLLALLAPAPALADDYCSERPGLGEPSCVMRPGRLSVETAGVDWTHDRAEEAVTDTLVAGDTLLRYGIPGDAELRLGWTPYGHVRTRDRASGAVDAMAGTGDATVGLKRSLLDPSGEGRSAAVVATLSLPVGSAAIGAGDWGASLQLPVSLPLAPALKLGMTPEIDAAVDEDRHGRHVAFGAAGGFTLSASKALDIALEAMVIRDDDPAEHRTRALGGLSFALMLGADLQLDAGSAIGLNAATPDAEAYIGISRRF